MGHCTVREGGVEKELQYFLSWTCAPGICRPWGVVSSFCSAPKILPKFYPFSSSDTIHPTFCLLPFSPILFLCSNFQTSSGCYCTPYSEHSPERKPNNIYVVMHLIKVSWEKPSPTCLVFSPLICFHPCCETKGMSGMPGAVFTDSYCMGQKTGAGLLFDMF